MRPLLLLTGLLLSGPALALDTVREIQTCVQGNVPQRAVRQDLAITHHNRSGKPRQMIGRLFLERSDKDLLKMVMKLQQPKALFNAAYLFLQGTGYLPDKLRGIYDDQVHMYLPAARKPREIQSSSVGSELFGTNLNTADIKHLFGSLSGSRVQLDGQGKHQGRRAYRVDITPYEQSSPYSRVVVLIDAATCLAGHTSFYAANGKLEKTLSQEMSRITKVDGRFVGHDYTMQDAHSAEKTQLILGNVHYDKDIPDTLFHPDGFYR